MIKPVSQPQQLSGLKRRFDFDKKESDEEIHESTNLSVRNQKYSGLSFENLKIADDSKLSNSENKRNLVVKAVQNFTIFI